MNFAWKCTKKHDRNKWRNYGVNNITCYAVQYTEKQAQKLIPFVGFSLVKGY